MEGFGPKRPTLKPGAVPTVFSFSQQAKRRKLSEAREARALHRSIIDELLAGPSAEPSAEPLSIEEPEPATRDVGIQCG